MKVVVTGGAGFIGSNLGRELLGRSDVDEVVALDDLSTGSRANLDGTGINLSLITGASTPFGAFGGASDPFAGLGSPAPAPQPPPPKRGKAQA